MSTLPTPVFDDSKPHLRIYHGDCLDILEKIPPSSVDLVFADPPYFLSNGGITCHAGKMVSVNKGSWDVSHPNQRPYRQIPWFILHRRNLWRAHLRLRRQFCLAQILRHPQPRHMISLTLDTYPVSLMRGEVCK
jgi:hypothetical protein